MRSLSLILCLALSFSGSAALAQSKSKAKKTKTTTSKTTKKMKKEETPVPSEDPSLLTPSTTTEMDSGSTGLMGNSAPVESTPPPMEAPAPVASSDSSHDHGHLFGVHAALGVPHPLNFGLNYVMPSHLLSFAVAAGSFNATSSDVELGIGNSEIALRWHPFYGSFYVGALYGQQNIKAKKTEVIQAQSVTAEVEVKSNYLTPHVGWMWGAENGGFFASMDIGYQMPSNVTTTFTSNADPAVQATQDYADLSKDVRDGGDKIGNTALPYWSMVKVGWLF